MPPRSVLRRVVPALVAVAVATPAAHALPITYTFAGTVSLPSVGARSFTATFTGDASSATDLAAIFPGAPSYALFANLANTATLSSPGLGTVDLASLLGSQFVVGAVNGIPGAPAPFAGHDHGVGFLGLSPIGVTLAFYLPDDGMPHYDLGSSFGPITGTAYAYLGPISDPSQFDPRHLITVRNASFTATAAPEPATYVLTASGLVVVFGFARRRRQTI